MDKFEGDGLSERERQALAYIEQKDGPTDSGPEVYDSSFVKGVVSRLKKAVNNNLADRDRYSSEPLRFLASEEQLHEAIKSFGALAETQLYQEVVASDALETLLGLLDHANTDIVALVVQVLGDLAGSDDPKTPDLVAELLKLGLITRLMAVFESDDFKEPIMDLLVDLCEDNGPDKDHSIELGPTVQPLIQCMGHLDQEYTAICASAAETLATVLLKDRSLAQDLGPHGLEKILEAVSWPLQHIVTVGPDTLETLANLFVVLSLAVREDRLKPAFLDLEGVQLMVLLLKDKSMGAEVRTRALQVLAEAQRGLGSQVSDTIVRAGALKHIFRFLTLTEDRAAFAQAVQTIALLLRWLDLDSVERLRVVAQLTEPSRLELVLSRWSASITDLTAVENKIQQERAVLDQHSAEISGPERASVETEWQLRLADAGADVVQNLATIVAWLLLEDDYKIRARISRHGESPQSMALELRQAAERLQADLPDSDTYDHALLLAQAETEAVRDTLETLAAALMNRADNQRKADQDKASGQDKIDGQAITDKTH